MEQVQSVTWATMVGCPCDRCWWLVLSCSPSDPSVKGWVTLAFDSSPIKETFENCLFQDFDGFQGRFSASEGLISVWNHLPDASFRRRSPVSEAAARTRARSAEASCMLPLQKQNIRTPQVVRHELEQHLRLVARKPLAANALVATAAFQGAENLLNRRTQTRYQTVARLLPTPQLRIAHCSHAS